MQNPLRPVSRSSSFPEGKRLHKIGRSSILASTCFIVVLMVTLALVPPRRVQSATGTALAVADATPQPGRANERLAGQLMLQIHQYEQVYYQYRPNGDKGGDWSQLDSALETRIGAWPEFSRYYSWLRLKYRRNGSEDFRYPAVLRADIQEYLAAPPPPPVAPIGQPLTVASWEMSVVTWEGLGAGPLVWSKAGNSLPARGSWIRIAVRVKNIGKESRYLYPCDFEVDDAQGRVAPCPKSPAAVAYSAYAGASPLAELVRPGAVAQYWLIFDIVPGATYLQLVFKQDQGAAFDLWR